MMRLGNECVRSLLVPETRLPGKNLIKKSTAGKFSTYL